METVTFIVVLTALANGFSRRQQLNKYNTHAQIWLRLRGRDISSRSKSLCGRMRMQFVVTNIGQIWGYCFYCPHVKREWFVRGGFLFQVLCWLDEQQVTENSRYWLVDCCQVIKGDWYYFFHLLLEI